MITDINKHHRANPVNSSRGAPMGRFSDPMELLPEGTKCRLQKLRIDSSGYDAGGAYWGLSMGAGGVYCLFTCDPVAEYMEHYVRVKDRKALVEHLKDFHGLTVR